jgi:hypothetical protein
VILVHGVYRWRPRLVAFRRDFCLRCTGEQLSVAVQTFDVLHLFWVPVLPLGRRSRWLCSHCGAPPHAVVSTRRIFKLAGVGAAAIGAILLWLLPLSEIPSEDHTLLWIFRLALPLAALALLAWALRQAPEVRLAERLATVAPFAGWSCPLCGGELVRTAATACGQCGAEHRPLGA